MVGGSGFHRDLSAVYLPRVIIHTGFSVDSSEYCAVLLMSVDAFYHPRLLENDGERLANFRLDKILCISNKDLNQTKLRCKHCDP